MHSNEKSMTCNYTQWYEWISLISWTCCWIKEDRWFIKCKSNYAMLLEIKTMTTGRWGERVGWSHTGASRGADESLHPGSPYVELSEAGQNSSRYKLSVHFAMLTHVGEGWRAKRQRKYLGLMDALISLIVGWILDVNVHRNSSRVCPLKIDISLYISYFSIKP